MNVILQSKISSTWKNWIDNFYKITPIVKIEFHPNNSNCIMINSKQPTTVTDYFHAFLQLKQKQKLILKLSRN